MDGERWWAATYDDEYASEGLVVTTRRLVLAYAETPMGAAAQTGLVFEHFREATDDEVDRWSNDADEPLTPREIHTLLGMLARAQRQVGSKRRKSRERGRRDADRKVARKYALLARKLELLLDDEEDHVKEAA